MNLLHIFIFSALIITPSIAPSTSHCDALQIFSQVRRITGWQSWDSAKEIVAEGSITDSGSKGTFHIARDLIAGRSTFSESVDQGRVAYVFDGRTLWEQDEGLGVHRLNAPESSERAITDAYIARNGFWKGASDPAQFACLSGDSRSASHFDIIRVSPRGGSAVDIWVDRSTHLIDRTDQVLPTTVRTTMYGDYRKVRRLTLPFEITTRFADSYGNPTVTAQKVTSYRILASTGEADFRRPPDPHNGVLLDRTRTTTIPFTVDKGVIVFDAMMNGLGPFSFTFDPGAEASLTTIASGPLDMKPGTMANVRQIRIGDAEVNDLTIPVYAGKPTDLFPERDPSQSPIAGSLGPEILDRFAVRLNYAAQTMTLSPPQTFRCIAPDVAQAFTMQQDDDIPLVPAKIDGHAGLLQFDVRAPSSLLLFRPFMEATALASHYRSARGTIASLVVGGVSLHGVPAHFITATIGKFASRTEAGLAGYRLLSQFTTTIDYRTQTICFEHRNLAPPKHDHER